jgi:hypothetical protein
LRAIHRHQLLVLGVALILFLLYLSRIKSNPFVKKKEEKKKKGNKKEQE